MMQQRLGGNLVRIPGYNWSVPARRTHKPQCMALSVRQVKIRAEQKREEQGHTKWKQHRDGGRGAVRHEDRALPPSLQSLARRGTPRSARQAPVGSQEAAERGSTPPTGLHQNPPGRMTGLL
ncbi:hypothetical protein SKAU_G00317150 [Synaphobranchus kaupii]|uniref:Uncharacterized protein n=1 Tax=Synaphobranchus kaupii TaxID=118154 RepID=A0A9Q1ESV4_SYNKA|nr:hypothetical protein SKAU_G00317150 [Synaphobranchus kaupii]